MVLFGLANGLEKVCSVWPRVAKVCSVWPMPVLGRGLHPGKLIARQEARVKETEATDGETGFFTGFFIGNKMGQGKTIRKEFGGTIDRIRASSTIVIVHSNFKFNS